MIETNLVRAEPAQLEIGDPASQRLRTLAQEVRRGASEDQEPSRKLRSICHHSEYREELWSPLDLIDDNEAPKILDREGGVGKTGLIPRVLKIEKGHLVPIASGRLSGEGGLSNLARTDDADDREPTEAGCDLTESTVSRNHRFSLY